MKFVYGALLPLFLLALGACKKPVLEVTEGTIPPLILSIAIEDSLPAKTIQALDLEGTTGLKIQYYSGLYNSYFEYEADNRLLLEEISSLPFPMNSRRSDTQCRLLSFETFKTIRKDISTAELENTAHFWDTDEASYQIFECIKPPYKHILQLERGTDHVLHRIELLEET
jgi:hypothetical protein